MSKISREYIGLVKNNANILQEIGAVVKLKRVGNNYKGLCPFHTEKTPSFMVSESKKIYKCFGCGAGGDVFSFICNYYNMNFKDAVLYLGDKNGNRND